MGRSERLVEPGCKLRHDLRKTSGHMTAPFKSSLTVCILPALRIDPSTARAFSLQWPSRELVSRRSEYLSHTGLYYFKISFQSTIHG